MITYDFTTGDVFLLRYPHSLHLFGLHRSSMHGIYIALQLVTSCRDHYYTPRARQDVQALRALPEASLYIGHLRESDTEVCLPFRVGHWRLLRT